MERTLDWKPNWDKRNNLYTIGGLDCYSNGAERTRIRRQRRVWLDQGREGACTGFGTAHALATPPMAFDFVNHVLAQGLYYEARRQDEWEGEDYDGSSVNGVMKAARLAGYVSEWRWCRTLPEVRHALSYHGALVIGVTWYEGMFDADINGMIRVDGEVVGGHCLELVGYDNGLYRLENSWGRDWGDNGGCFISEADLQLLLSDHGEFAVPKKIKT